MTMLTWKHKTARVQEAKGGKNRDKPTTSTNKIARPYNKSQKSIEKEKDSWNELASSTISWLFLARCMLSAFNTSMCDLF
jgi:hypothetical protein